MAFDGAVFFPVKSCHTADQDTAYFISFNLIASRVLYSAYQALIVGYCSLLYCCLNSDRDDVLYIFELNSENAVVSWLVGGTLPFGSDHNTFTSTT